MVGLVGWLGWGEAERGGGVASARPAGAAGWHGQRERAAPHAQRRARFGWESGIPCGTWKWAPIGRDMPWMSVTDEFEKAIPACVAAFISASRAASLCMSAHAARSAGGMARIAVSA